MARGVPNDREDPVWVYPPHVVPVPTNLRMLRTGRVVGPHVEVRDLGQLIIEIGICPVKPAEFVIFRISQWSGPATS